MNLLGASMSPDQAIKQETRNDRHTSFGFSCHSCHSRTEASQQDGAPVASGEATEGPLVPHLYLDS